VNINFATKKIVIILGAGSTYADAEVANEYEKPPLDKKFFQKTHEFINKSKFALEKKKELLYEFEYIKAYFEIWHGKKICSDKEDSLEKVMSRLFSDVRDESLTERPAFQVFIAFLKLFYDVLGETTNNITADRNKWLFKIVESYFKKGIKPENLTIISFNYDIYAEKILVMLPGSFYDPDSKVFVFQHCYDLNLVTSDFTRPPHPRKGWFPMYPKIKKGGVRVLKLHGSLNWYSVFPFKKIDLDEMFNRERLLKVSDEKEIYSNKLKYRTREGNLFYTLPVIVPPIHKKSETYHSKILVLWHNAKEALSTTDELLIYGYSCPSLDSDSKNLLKKSIKSNKKIQKISVIDPDPTIFDRYNKLFASKRIQYFQDSESFLEEIG